MPRVYVSIGSNVERERNIRAAVTALRARFGLLHLSRVYQTPAVGFAGEDFYNLVAAFDTAEPIERVRETLIAIEAAQGRERNGPRFGPRTLDLDILLYGDLVRHSDGFDVPRGEITQRAFVLGPLAELAPDLRHPETGESLREMWERFGGERRLKPVEMKLD